MSSDSENAKNSVSSYCSDSNNESNKASEFPSNIENSSDSKTSTASNKRQKNVDLHRCPHICICMNNRLPIIHTSNYKSNIVNMAKAITKHPYCTKECPGYKFFSSENLAQLPELEKKMKQYKPSQSELEKLESELNTIRENPLLLLDKYSYS